MWLLYTWDELDNILGNLRAGKKRMKIGNNQLYFTGKDILIQRIENRFFGLAYDMVLIYNYPHIDNVNTVFSNSILTTKYNGTNIGLLKDGRIRTRGAVEPDRFPVQLNVAILTEEKRVVGISDASYSAFAEKYKPILREGIDKGIIDEYGNFVLSAIKHEIKEKLGSALENGEVVFAELVSKYNPIAVDGELKYGLYLNMDKDYELILFDRAVATGRGIELEPVTKTYDKVPTAKVVTSSDKFAGIEEGVVIKSPEGYGKMKREEVLQWERAMGMLSTIVWNSVDHVFASGIVTKEQALGGSFATKEGINSITEQVWEEIETHAVTREDLVKYFGDERKLDGIINYLILKQLSLLVAPELEVPKERLYLELPKYIDFGENVLLWNEKRGKYIPTGSYARLVSGVIGRMQK